MQTMRRVRVNEVSLKVDQVWCIKIHLAPRFGGIGVRAGAGGGARGVAAPPNFGQLRFFGQQEKILAKPAFEYVVMFFY